MTDQDHSVDRSSPEPPPSTADPGPAPATDLATPPGASSAGTAATAVEPADGADDDGPSRSGSAAARRRRRGSRGGRGRRRPNGADAGDGVDEDGDEPDGDAGAEAPVGADLTPPPPAPRRRRPSEPDELPDRPIEGKVQDVEAADRALVRKPQIGDSRPAPTPPAASPAAGAAASAHGRSAKVERTTRERSEPRDRAETSAGGKNKRRRKTSRASGAEAKGHPAGPVALDADVLERRRGRERNGRPVGRYLMCVHVRPELVQIAVLQGRSLIEHYVSRPQDDVAQIHGNIYLGRVQNVLPGMEAAFVDIGTPKNAVLYRGDVQYDAEDLLEPRGRNAAERPRIEQLLKNKQLIVCQVTKNPIGAKGARLTQEVSLPGRFVVLIPNSRTYGISKRLADDERRRLRSILDRVKPEEHGLIVRTAAENVSEEELRADVLRLAAQWEKISAKAKQARGPSLLYREPGLAVRVIREELNADYRGVVIDDPDLYHEVSDYVGALNPELADRIERYDPEAEGLPLFERHHVHEQLHKALDRKVWLPSGGSLIIEHTEALTVIDVNTGKNVGTSNLEETVFHNNLEAADEIARQLRLRDIGGIIVIDFIDMEIRENRHKVVASFRDALARDKTRTQVFDISELGLVEMTRKRIGEGLLTAFAHTCPNCEGRGLVVDHSLIG
jgi:ribonuclease E